MDQIDVDGQLPVPIDLAGSTGGVHPTAHPWTLLVPVAMQSLLLPLQSKVSIKLSMYYCPGSSLVAEIMTRLG